LSASDLRLKGETTLTGDHGLKTYPGEFTSCSNVVGIDLKELFSDEADPGNI